MDIVLVGPGRAGLALSLRLTDAGHAVVGVLARDRTDAVAAADRLGGGPLRWDEPLPSADLLLVAVRDDAIEEVAVRLSRRAGSVEGAVHLSGVGSVDLLRPLGRTGLAIGSFHPLQTIPTPEAGAARLEGAWAAITSDDDLFADRLFSLAASMGMRPFELLDDAKPLYHAAAAAAANFPLAALAMSQRLFEGAGVPFEAAAPLVRAVVGNALEMGPAEALTGPIARGDIGTVRRQLEAVRELDAGLAEDFSAMGRATARVSGTSDEMKDVLDG